ncbi:MAG TPA: GAF domain-containing protein [Stellaceae bacterium]|nr:GAF domain-containing protein [Stellaceae bacterium]
MTQRKAVLALSDIAAILDSTARDRDPQTSLRAIDALAQRIFRHKLFTVMRLLAAGSEVERVYSSNPAAYPVGGRKQKQDTSWGQIVLNEGKPFIARNEDELRAVFPDHDLILSLGIGSIMNIPVMFKGQCVGTMNVSGEAGQYGEEDVRPGRILAGLIVPFIL